MSISPQLGREHRVEIPAGAISYRDCGNGSPIVFVHGVGVNGDLWRRGRAAPGRRPSLHHPRPAGGAPTRIPLEPRCPICPCQGWRGSPRTSSRLWTLDNIAIVANDTGGAVAQALVGCHPDRIARLVLTSCDAFEKFPPTPQKYLEVTGAFAAARLSCLAPCSSKPIQRLPTAYGFVTSAGR